MPSTPGLLRSALSRQGRSEVLGKLIALIAQRLLRRAEDGRIAWREILIADGPDVRPTIELPEDVTATPEGEAPSSLSAYFQD